MALTSAMMTGFTGIATNGVGVDTVGNNLANLNTTAFKSERVTFETLLYRTISEGEAPSATTGGTLPRQVGTGSGVASMQRDFGQGGVDATGFQSDLAVNGDGFFIVDAPAGGQLYTRDGAFRFDDTQRLVSANGSPLQGFGVDADGNILPGALTDVVIPLGSTSPARATTEVLMDGRLDPTTNVASAGAVVASQPLVTASGAAATENTPLTDLVNESGVRLFATGDELLINGSKGGISMESSAFTVGTTGSTVGDLAAHLQQSLGIQVDPALVGNPGATVENGALVIRSNTGEVNAVQLDAGSITNLSSTIVPSPFEFGQQAAAVGEGVTTSFNVFDSLGNPAQVRLRMALDSKTDAGTTWRFYAESVDDTDLSPALGTGTITFDANGQFVSATGLDIAIDRANQGSVTPLAFALDLDQLTGLASLEGSSEVIMDSQDGAPSGIMLGYHIAQDGVITGLFSNQQEQVLGQVALATFVNDEGLVAQGDNTFAIGPDSGPAAVTAPQIGTAGSVDSGALEQSNVEIAREFVNLISYSTGISAASRVVRTADDLLQELLLLAR